MPLQSLSIVIGPVLEAFTMDVYSHIIEGIHSDVMALLGEVLFLGKNAVSQQISANVTLSLKN